jgi:hypothetical protein
MKVKVKTESYTFVKKCRNPKFCDKRAPPQYLEQTLAFIVLPEKVLILIKYDRCFFYFSSK